MKKKADSATVSSLVSSFGSMAYSSLADYKCDDKSKYGLDKPYATITVDYQEEVADDDNTQDDTTASGETADEDASSVEENSDDAEQDTESDESVSETTDETSETEDTDGEEAEDETSENQTVHQTMRILRKKKLRWQISSLQFLLEMKQMTAADMSW